MLYEHLYELLLTIYNNTELGAGTPMMQYSAKKKCLDMMSDKLRVSEDSACFYLVDTESSLRLFSAGNGVSNQKKSALKAFSIPLILKLRLDFRISPGQSKKLALKCIS